MLENQLKFNYKRVPIIDEKYFRKLSDFSCANEGLNNFLQGEAIKFHNQGLGLTTLIINEENDDIMGYYTIRSNALQYCTEDSELSYVLKPEQDNSEEKYINLYEVIPVIEITRFAIDLNYSRKRLGSAVLAELIMEEIIGDIATKIGINAIFVLSSPDAVGFYEFVGFQQFPQDIQKRIKDSETNGCIGLYYTLFNSEE